MDTVRKAVRKDCPADPHASRRLCRLAYKNHKNPSQNGSFSFVADPKAPFVPILPQDLKAVACRKFFRSLGSKTDPVLHIQYPPEW